MAHHACQSLVTDQRGVILVPALAMGALLTGALFYVAGVGDAVMFRTELQNAADATSFTSAVWHARGMNAIAVLNILMSAVLAVFALMRIFEIVMFLIGLIPVVGEASMTIAVNTVARETTVARWVDRGLTLLSDAEDGVSLGIPYVALADAKSKSTAASSVMPFSMSLIPPALDARLGKEPRRPEDLPAALPIQKDEFGELCGKAVAFVPNQLQSAIEKLPVSNIPFVGGFVENAFSELVEVLIGDVLETVFSKGDGVFCQPLVGVLTDLIPSGGKSKTCDAARSKDDKARKDRQERNEEKTKDGGTLSDEEQKQAEADKDPEKLKCRDKSKSPKAEAGAIKFTAVPSKMWEMAGNGNVFMHSWSWVSGEPKLFQWGQEGLAIADNGRTPSVTPKTGADAMSEFYFDCDKTWGDASCEKKGTWSPNWTARVRRFRSPLEGLLVIGVDTPTGWLDTAQQSIGDHVGDIATKALEKLTGIRERDAVSEWISRQVEKIPVIEKLSQKIDSAVGGLRDNTGIDDLLNPRNFTDEQRIH
jgi:hypothetical protein